MQAGSDSQERVVVTKKVSLCFAVLPWSRVVREWACAFVGRREGDGAVGDERRAQPQRLACPKITWRTQPCRFRILEPTAPCSLLDPRMPSLKACLPSCQPASQSPASPPAIAQGGGPLCLAVHPLPSQSWRNSNNVIACPSPCPLHLLLWPGMPYLANSAATPSATAPAVQ